jgi:chaperone BCS1
MEDVDVLFSSQKRDLDKAAGGADAKAKAYQQHQAAVAQVPMPMRGMRGTVPMYPGYMAGSSGGSNISLSAMLNAIDGVEATEGRLLFLTTNALHDLDAALVRPGRVDLFVHYKRATTAQAEELFNSFYTVTPSGEELLDDVDSEKKPSVGTKSSVSAASKQHHMSLERVPLHPFELPGHITERDIASWAKEWSGCVEDEIFTIAELQGMLLCYKKEPELAVQAMPGWVAKELASREQAELEKRQKVEKEAAAEAPEEDKEEEAAVLAPKKVKATPAAVAA